MHIILYKIQKLRAQCVAHKEEQRLNGQIVIIHEFQFSEILTKADFYRNTQIINPSINSVTGFIWLIQSPLLLQINQLHLSAQRFSLKCSNNLHFSDLWYM